MSADVLRQAAALMRERAEAATPGPWVATDVNGLPIVFDTRDLPAPVVYDQELRSPDAAYIAGMHPAVAVAIADWLTDEAHLYEENEALWLQSSQDPRNRWQERGLTVEGNLEHHYRPALAVARAYLGGAS